MAEVSLWGNITSLLSQILKIDTQKEEAKITNTGIPTTAELMSVLVETTDKTTNDRNQYTGYVKKSDLAEITPQTIPIPQNYVGLEAINVPTRLQEQYFEIYNVVENEDEVVITARHIWYQNLQNFTLWKGEEGQTYTGAEVCRNVMNNAMFPSSFVVTSDCAGTLPGKELDYERKNLVEAFLDPEKGICKKFGLSLVRNNNFFFCLKNVGYDRGMVIQNGKNLLGVQRTESIENVVTRVAPIGKTTDGKIVWLNNNGLKYVDSIYINEYTSPRCEIYDTGLQIGKDDVTEQNINAKLLQAGQKRFSVDKVDLPEVTMEVEFLSLGDTEEYVQYRDLDKVYLYDIITIKDTVRGYNYAAQVIGVEHDILTGMLLSVTIGSLKPASASRKIAVWQVPEVDGTNIRLASIREGAYAPESITADSLMNGIVGYVHLAQATIDHLNSDSIVAVTANIHDIIAGSITADDIQAGSITTETLAANSITSEKIAANAITTEKISAGAVTAINVAANAITAEKIAAGSVTSEKIQAGAIQAGNIAAGAITTEKLGASSVSAEKIAANAITSDKIEAGAITATKLSTNDLSAIQAKLQIADIANARIAVADINYAHIKDLTAGSAYFGQTVFEEAVGGKLYVPRLSVGYAQMLGATIGDLVIQASDENYYKIDVGLDGAVVATEVYPTQEEIEEGHTEDGRTIYMGTDILATDLNTENIYASHALMNEITAEIINVDSLFAREATISQINAMDLSSNTYIRSTIGDWSSGSTITQTINSLNSRISSLGYGTIYYSETEPSHSELVEGDIWVQPLEDQTWNEVRDVTWEDLSTDTWDNVLGRYKMYTWTGTKWRLLYDTTINASMETEIQQLASQITLKADRSDVDVLSGEVSDFAATLEIQADEISSAVSAVNAKVASYVMPVDPRTAHIVSIGDMWIKTNDDFSTWGTTLNTTWGDLKNNHLWKDPLGDETYVWNGTEWVMTADRATEVYQGTQIEQTRKMIELEAETRAKLGDYVVNESARLTVTSSKIEQEVIRATNAENGKIAKTTQYQTADQIVSEAVAQSNAYAGQTFIQRTGIYQSAQSIVQEAVRESSSAAAGNFIAKTQVIQTADDIISEAVRQSSDEADSAYIHRTSRYQSADDIIDEAVAESGTDAESRFLQKTTTYQSADKIYQEAVKQAGANASTSYIAKSGIYQTAEDIVTSVEGYTDGKLTDYSTTEETATMISTEVGTYVDGQLANYSTTQQTALQISAYVTNNAYEKASGISITAEGVDVSGNKHINLDINATNYVHLNDQGIEMRGSKVSFVDTDGLSYSAFGRDDIKILKNSDNEQAVINDMVNRGKHDWVLIKPYYDATVDYAYSAQYNIRLNNPIVAFARTTNTSFADSGSAYTYTISGVCESQNPGTFAFSCNVKMSNDPNMQTYHTLQLRNIDLGGMIGTFSYTGYFTAGANLCGEGKVLYIQFELVNYSYNLTNLKMHCTTDSATSKVPCTVYYFP